MHKASRNLRKNSGAAIIFNNILSAFRFSTCHGRAGRKRPKEVSTTGYHIPGRWEEPLRYISPEMFGRRGEDGKAVTGPSSGDALSAQPDHPVIRAFFE